MEVDACGQTRPQAAKQTFGWWFFENTLLGLLLGALYTLYTLYTIEFHAQAGVLPTPFLSLSPHHRASFIFSVAFRLHRVAAAQVDTATASTNGRWSSASTVGPNQRVDLRSAVCGVVGYSIGTGDSGCRSGGAARRPTMLGEC